MNDYSEEIHQIFNQVLQPIGLEKGEDFVNKIRHILFINLRRGRLLYFLNQNHTIQDYVAHVVTTYESISPKLENLRQRREAFEWNIWAERFETWAYNFFRKKGMLPEQAQSLARDSAADTAVVILTAHFPYDCDFEPWANIIVQNMCRKLWKQIKQQWEQTQNLVALDEQFENQTDPLAAEPDRLVEEEEQQLLHREKVLAAVAHLSPKRQKVIRRHELDGLPLAELAKEMGTTLNSIYSLHSRAMDELQALLQEK